MAEQRLTWESIGKAVISLVDRKNVVHDPFRATNVKISDGWIQYVTEGLRRTVYVPARDVFQVVEGWDDE